MTCEARSAIQSDRILSELWTYWNKQRGSEMMPSRKDIDPIDMPAVLPHLQLIEPVGDRFRFRLTGTAIVQMYGADMTGKYADEFLPGNRAAAATQNFRFVIESGKPLFARSNYTVANGAEFVSSRIVLPLRIGINSVAAMILMGATFEFASKYRGTETVRIATLVSISDREWIDARASIRT